MVVNFSFSSNCSFETPAISPARLDCVSKTIAPLTPVPASNTAKATSLFLDATIGAIRPPSLCPINPILSVSISVLVFK